MKVELYKIVLGVEALQKLKETNEMPFNLAWQIDDIIEICKKHYERFTNEKNALVKKLGKQDKDNAEQYEIRKEDINLFNQEIEKISQFKIDLNGLVKLKKDDLLNLTVTNEINFSALKTFIENETN